MQDWHQNLARNLWRQFLERVYEALHNKILTASEHQVRQTVLWSIMLDCNILIYLKDTVVILSQVKPVVRLEHLIHELGQTHALRTVQPWLHAEQAKPHQITSNVFICCRYQQPLLYQLPPHFNSQSAIRHRHNIWWSLFMQYDIRWNMVINKISSYWKLRSLLWKSKQMNLYST